MRILLLSDNFYPETNAIASRVYERARYWVTWGHEVTVITSVPNFPDGKVFKGYKNKWYQIEYIDGIKVVRVKTFIAKNQGMLLRILDFLSYVPMAVYVCIYEKKPDVVFATSPQFFVGVTGWIVSKIKNRPFVLEIADLWPASIIAVGVMKKNFLLTVCEKLELFLYRNADLIIALTQSYKEDMVKRGVDGKKIHVIYNGADLEFYHPQPKDAVLLKQLALEDKFVIGYIGTHGMAHGLEHVLEVAESVKNNHKVVFLFVGAGVAREKLIKKAKELDLKNVHFISVQPKEIIASYWSLCDIALVHLKDEPLFQTVIPSKIFEAMAMGIPILLVAPQGEASNLITQEGVGIWITPDSPLDFVNAIKKLQDKNIRKKIAEQCVIRSQEHTREFQAREICKVLKNHIL